jgi:hypothetical protein
MSSHWLPTGWYLLTFVAALSVYIPINVQSAASIGGQITDQHGVVSAALSCRQLKFEEMQGKC